MRYQKPELQILWYNDTDVIKTSGYESGPNFGGGIELPDTPLKDFE